MGGLLRCQERVPTPPAAHRFSDSVLVNPSVLMLCQQMSQTLLAVLSVPWPGPDLAPGAELQLPFLLILDTMFTNNAMQRALSALVLFSHA